MKRICIFSTAYLPHIGGAEIAVKEITDRVSAYQFDCITARLDRRLPQKETIGNVTIHRVGWGIPILDKLYLAFFGHRTAQELHSIQQFDAAWAVMASFGGLAAERFVQKTKLPFLLTLQEGDAFDDIAKKARFTGGRFAKVFARATMLQAISTYLLAWGKEMGFAGKGAQVVPNGVALEQFGQEFDAEVCAEKRASLGFPEHAIIAITVSRLVKKNGVADSIVALTKLPSEYCLVIAGDGELATSLDELVQMHGLADRVRFLGVQEYETLPLLLQSCDMFVRPSITEGLGNVFLEAMAAGLPTIGTRVGGIVDFLEDGITGVVCMPEDPQSVADAFVRVHDLPDKERTAMITRAQEMITDRFTWNNIAQKMQSIFDQLCAL